MDNVYILLVRRSIFDVRQDTYIDMVYSSEENAWNRIEEKFYPFVEQVNELGYKVRSVIFSPRKLVVEYDDPIDDFYRNIQYEIHERRVNNVLGV